MNNKKVGSALAKSLRHGNMSVVDSSSSCCSFSAEENAFLRDFKAKCQSQPDLFDAVVKQLKVRSGSSIHRRQQHGSRFWRLLLCFTIAIQAYAISRGFAQTPMEELRRRVEKPCLYKAWMFLLETARYPSRCQETCGGLKGGHVDIEFHHNLTVEKFTRIYRDPARPVIVRNGTQHWAAMEHFNLSFFRNLYDGIPGSYAPHHMRNKLLPFRLPLDCKLLRQAFHMPEDQLAKPWYFGWSNVDLKVHWELQKYYRVPEFLPSDTEHGQMEWFFMGTSQEAAYLHIDHTVKPAWQAQIRGRKIWELHPPAECMFQCAPVTAHLQEGDIFVIDPSVWYHGTYVYPGELSITFGMEFV